MCVYIGISLIGEKGLQESKTVCQTAQCIFGSEFGSMSDASPVRGTAEAVLWVFGNLGGTRQRWAGHNRSKRTEFVLRSLGLLETRLYGWIDLKGTVCQNTARRNRYIRRKIVHTSDVVFSELLRAA